MRLPGKIYLTNQGTFIAIYTKTAEDIYRAPLPSMKDKCTRVAHVGYGNKKERQGIDVFLVDNNIYKLNSMGKELWSSNNNPDTIIINGNESENKKLIAVDLRNQIHYQLLSAIKRKTSTESLLNAVRKDILEYTPKPSTPTQSGPLTQKEYFDEIIAVTQMKAAKEKQYLTSGKQDYVPQCIFDGNLDIHGGCFSGIATGPNAKITGNSFIDHYLDFFGYCEYCYALFKQNSFFEKKQLKREQLKEELIKGYFTSNKGVIEGPIKFLRLGKTTEFSTEHSLSDLILTLEVCNETGTKVIMPTKYLTFDKEVANLSKKTGSVFLFSLGPNQYEPGAMAHGSTNESRLEQAIKFKQTGANAMLYLMIEATSGPTKEQEQILKTAEKYHIGVQLLPMRFSKKSLFYEMTSLNWNTIRDQTGLHSHQDNSGKYEILGASSYAVAKIIHHSWSELIGKNEGRIRMCHHNNKTVFCGGCFLKSGSVHHTGHYKKVKYLNSRKPRHPKSKEQKKRDEAIKKQPSIFD